MESRLIIFLAFVAVELIFNTVTIVLAYKLFSDMTTKLTGSVSAFQKSPMTRQCLTTFQRASEQAVKVTGAAKDQIIGLEPAVERMQAAHAERLARAGVRFNLVVRAVRFTIVTLNSAVAWPLKNIHTAMTFVRGAVDFIRGSESGADARPTRTR